VLVPNAAKLSRIDPMGEHGAYFDRLRARQKMFGSLAGVLGWSRCYRRRCTDTEGEG
jgi:hypothetical protein